MRYNIEFRNQVKTVFGAQSEVYKKTKAGEDVLALLKACVSPVSEIELANANKLVDLLALRTRAKRNLEIQQLIEQCENFESEQVLQAKFKNLNTNNVD